ncbi:MAG TPA: DUF3572 family protein [Alphaproteobacteria bacterium]|nr:DUF3572 family protein [Alphaproteobacteria bacterium]
MQRNAILDNPEAVAIRALGFIASRSNELGRFLSRTGLSSAELNRKPANPRYLTAILDFLITDETTLQEFARTVDLPPEAAYEARRLVGHTPVRTAFLVPASKDS